MLKKLILPLALVCAAAIGFMLWALLGCNSDNQISHETPTYVPPAFDSSAEKGVPKLDNVTDYKDFDAKNYRFSLCAKPVLSDDKLEVYLTDPDDSGVLLKIRVLDENDDIIGESGLIGQGEYLPTVTIKRQVSMAKLKIMAYEPETFYSAGGVVINIETKS